MTAENYSISAGSVIGRDHYLVRKNNQDSYCVVSESGISVAVITDGCGDKSSIHSESGSQIGSRVVTYSIVRNAKRFLAVAEPPLYEPWFWERVHADVLARFRVLALDMSDSLTEIVSKYFLFTIVGVLISEKVSVFFSIGDGVIFVNGERIQIGPFPGNEPPYLGYSLLAASQTDLENKSFKFQIQHVCNTSDLNTFLLGCDGVLDLLNAEGKKFLGKEDSVEPISEFWTHQKYFSNPYALSRRLAVIGAEQRVVDWDNHRILTSPSFLPDDTTMIVGRRNKEQ